jgi:hypothetical protein
MKKILIAVLMLWSCGVRGQITLDQIVDSAYAGHRVYIGGNFYTADLSPTETKYVFLDDSSNTFSLYNMDFSPFMLNISVPEPFATSTLGFQPIYITRALFDCDESTIEYAYEAPTDCSRTFYVMRTDGTVLLQVDSANGPYCLGSCLGMSDYTRPIRNTSDGAKLFLQKCSVSNNGFYIYSLCGTLYTDALDFAGGNFNYVKVFPNPSSNSVTFQINQPDNLNEYELVLLDNNVREFKREKLKGSTFNYHVDLGNYASGTYYSLRTKTKIYQTGKFILNK